MARTTSPRRVNRPTRSALRHRDLESLESRQLLSLTPTTLELQVPTLQLSLGRTLPFTALVRTDDLASANVDGGTVTLRDGETIVGTAPVRDGIAGFQISTLDVGLHRFSASYSGTDQAGGSQTAITGAGIIRTVAGNGRFRYTGNDGVATQTAVTDPRGIAVDSSGTLYIVDPVENLVRKVTPGGVISTIAGTGQEGFSGDGGPALAARLSFPNDIAVDAGGNVFFTDAGNERIRKITPDGIITTIAGGEIGGDAPHGLAIDRTGNLIYTDSRHYRVRRLSPDGVVTTIAGNGTFGMSGDGVPALEASLGKPTIVDVDAAGSVYFTDFDFGYVRKITPDGLVFRIAGNGTQSGGVEGGLATDAGFFQPSGIAVDVMGNVYVADNGYARVRRITPGGIITTVAGTGRLGNTGDGGNARAADIGVPYTLAFDPSGNLLIGSPSSRIVRSVSATTDVEVTRRFTATTLTAAAPSVRAGQAIRLIATIASPDGVVSEGTVTFRDGVDVVGTVDVRAGVANLTLTGATLGRHAFSATYSGSSAYRPSQPSITTSSPVRTVAGAGGGGTSAPHAVAVDRDGNLYIADIGTDTVRRVSPGGIVTTIAGIPGTPGYTGDGGPAAAATLDDPSGLAIDAAGNLFISDRRNHVVRRVTPLGIISTVVGDGTVGFEGNGGPATSGQLSGPQGLAFDASGNLYIADTDGRLIRRVSSDGILSIFVGDGYQSFPTTGPDRIPAFLRSPVGVAFDLAGNLLFSDDELNRVYRVSPAGSISIFAGNGGGVHEGDGSPADTASLDRPGALVRDPLGNVFIAENGRWVRLVVPPGLISTFAGLDSTGATPDGLPAVASAFDGLAGLAFDRAGNLYLADGSNGRVRVIEATTEVVVSRRPFAFRVEGLDASATAGDVRTITVTAIDENGTVLADYNGAILLTSSDPIASLPFIPTTGPGPRPPALLVNGTGTFAVLFRTAGRQSLTVTDAGEARMGEIVAFVDVVAAPPSRYELSVITGPILGSAPVGVVVKPFDAFGNPSFLAAVNLRVTTSDPLSKLPIGRSFSGPDASFEIRFQTAGIQSITVSDALDPSIAGTIGGLFVEPVTTGRIFLDRTNADPSAIPPGSGLGGRVVYVDMDNNGRLDAGEPTATADPDGSFRVAGLATPTSPVRDLGNLATSYRSAVSRYRDDGDGSATVGLVPFSPLAPVPVTPDPFGVNASSDEFVTYVRSLYRAVLGRDGADAEIRGWADALGAGQSRESVAARIVNSPEHRRRQVDAFYRAFLGREADVFSQAWVDELLGGASEAGVAAAILGSDEYLSAHRDDRSLVTSLYRDVLGRDADPIGQADATSALANGLNRRALVRRLVNSDEAIDQVIEGFYSGYLARGRDPLSKNWSEELRHPAGSASTVAVAILSSIEFLEKTEPSIPIAD